mmetsp:Transcript_10034/g.29540  ORF Transcript_10034/g.29540 Transcript_10034/m.29540 type:complete len:258 (+) Transcript_10034:909-1682(+)
MCVGGRAGAICTRLPAGLVVRGRGQGTAPGPIRAAPAPCAAGPLSGREAAGVRVSRGGRLGHARRPPAIVLVHPARRRRQWASARGGGGGGLGGVLGGPRRCHRPVRRGGQVSQAARTSPGQAHAWRSLLRAARRRPEVPAAVVAWGGARARARVPAAAAPVPATTALPLRRHHRPSHRRRLPSAPRARALHGILPRLRLHGHGTPFGGDGAAVAQHEGGEAPGARGGLDEGVFEELRCGGPGARALAQAETDQGLK